MKYHRALFPSYLVLTKISSGLFYALITWYDIWAVFPKVRFLCRTIEKLISVARNDYSIPIFFWLCRDSKKNNAHLQKSIIEVLGHIGGQYASDNALKKSQLIGKSSGLLGIRTCNRSCASWYGRLKWGRKTVQLRLSEVQYLPYVLWLWIISGRLNFCQFPTSDVIITMNYATLNRNAKMNSSQTSCLHALQFKMLREPSKMAASVSMKEWEGIGHWWSFFGDSLCQCVLWNLP